MSYLVKFRIPVAFILARLLPTPLELVYGFEHRWIGESDVVTIALAIYGETDEVPPAVEELALLLQEELRRVSELIRELRREMAEGDDFPARAWLFLALAWVYENEVDFLDPYEVVEMLYADFGYPRAIEGFVRFMPPPRGEPVGMSALAARWQGFLESEAAWFGARRSAGSGR